MKILVAGDFCPQKRVANTFDNNDFQSVLGEVKPLIEEADYAIVNFECPITKGNETPISKYGPNLRCSEKGLDAIRWTGFDCVTLANNHFYDFGEEGVKNTLETCRSLHIDTVGGGLNIKEASQILYKQVDGHTLAIINCCEHEFSIATDDTAGSNPLHPIQQYYSIQEAKTQADYILLIVHGGHELWQLPSPRMVETYRFFIDAGADAVVNHHQHCYSGYEFYKGKPIIYGLGNFCFDVPNNRNSKWNEGFLLKLFFDTNIGFELFPYSQCSEKAEVKLLPRDAFSIKLNELNTAISNPKILKTETEKYYASCIEQSSNLLEPIQNRYYLIAKHRGWLPSLISELRRLKAADLICCEAHRDKLTYFFNNNNN